MTKRYMIILTLMVLSGCYHMPDAVKPMAWLFKQMPQDAPANFKKGWIDGCESGLASMTNSFYRSNYRFQQDPAMRKDPVYYKTWKDTYTFCRHYAYGTIRQSNTRMRLSNNRSTIHERIAGGHNVLQYNLLNFWGPGKSGMFLENFGNVGGDPYINTDGGVLNVMDFTDDVALNGKQKGLNWDFRPEDGGMYHTTIDAWK